MKKVLSVFLAVLLAVSVGTCASGDAEVIASGEIGYDNPADIIWRLTSDGALTIEGTGAISHVYTRDLSPNEGLVRSVTVGEGVTNIMDFLDGCMALETVALPASLTYMSMIFTNAPRQFLVDEENPAFAVGPDGCLYNKNLTTLIKYAGGSERTAYTLPENVTSMKNGAFLGAVYLKKIVLHENVTGLAYNLFRACTALEEVTLPSRAVAYDGHLFYGCTALKSFAIPDWMTGIPFEMFNGCTALESVDIPDTVTDVDSGAFYGCTSLREIDLPEGMELLCADVVGGCTSLTSLQIPASVKTIQQYACSGCTALKTVNIPAGVTAIEKNAFKNCRSLRNVTIEMSPAQWAQVEIAEGNGDLLNATLHFTYGDVLDSGTCGADNPADAVWQLTSDGVLRISGEGAVKKRDWERVLHGDAGSWTAVKGEGLVKELVIGEGITRLADTYPFMALCALERVSLPASLQKLPEGSFAICPCILGFTVAAGNAEMAAGADGCLYSKDQTELLCYTTGSANETFTTPAGLKRICEYAFQYTDALKKVEIPDTVTSLGRGAFEQCRALEEAYLPARMESLGAAAFAACGALKSASFPQGIESVPVQYCTGTSLTRIELPEGVKELGAQAFAVNKKLTEVHIPSTLTAVGAEAFIACDSLQTVYIAMSPAQWAQVEIAEGNESLLGAELYFDCPHTHEWDAGTVTLEPTDHTHGTVRYKCAVCGGLKTVEVEPTGRHDWQYVPLSKAGLRQGELWLAANGVPVDGTWYADANTCVLKNVAADGTVHYYDTDAFLACVREAGVEWKNVAFGAEGLNRGDWYLDVDAFIDAVGRGCSDEEKQQAKALLLQYFRFYINPAGTLNVIRYTYTDLPDENGGTASGSVTYPLSLNAGAEDAFNYDYNTLRRCILQYTPAEQPEEKPEEKPGGFIGALKAVINTILSFFRRLFSFNKKNK